MIDFIPVSLLLAVLIWALIGLDRKSSGDVNATWLKGKDRKERERLAALTDFLNNKKR